MSTAIERAALRWRRVEVWSAGRVRGETWQSVMAAREAGRVARERLSVRQTPETVAALSGAQPARRPDADRSDGYRSVGYGDDA
jgi:hypothetical protein